MRYISLVYVAMTGALGACTHMAPTLTRDNNANIAVAMGYIDLVWIQGKPIEGYAKYVDQSRYIHHPGKAANADPAMLATFRAANPDFKYEVKQVFAEGDYVITHSLVTGAPGVGMDVPSPLPGAKPTPKVGDEVIDIFRIKKGKIVEQWDVVEAISGSTDGLF